MRPRHHSSRAVPDPLASFPFRIHGNIACQQHEHCCDAEYEFLSPLACLHPSAWHLRAPLGTVPWHPPATDCCKRNGMRGPFSHTKRGYVICYIYMNIRTGLFNVTICLTSYGPWNHQWTTWPQETLCISSKTWESNGYVHVLSYPMPSLYYLCTLSRRRRIVWASLTTTTVNYCRACTTLCTLLAVLTTATRTGDQRRGVCMCRCLCRVVYRQECLLSPCSPALTTSRDSRRLAG